MTVPATRESPVWIKPSVLIREVLSLAKFSMRTELNVKLVLLLSEAIVASVELLPSIFQRLSSKDTLLPTLNRTPLVLKSLSSVTFTSWLNALPSIVVSSGMVISRSSEIKSGKSVMVRSKVSLLTSSLANKSA